MAWFCGKSVCPNNGASVQNPPDWRHESLRTEHIQCLKHMQDLQEDSWRWEEKILSAPETCSCVCSRTRWPGPAHTPIPCGQSAGENQSHSTHTSASVCVQHTLPGLDFSWVNMTELLSAAYELLIKMQQRARGHYTIAVRCVIVMIMTYSEAVKELVQ